jgi:WD40 repeat protein
VVVELERQGTQLGHIAFCRFDDQPAIALVDDDHHIAVFTLHDGRRVRTIDVGADEPWWLESDPLGRRLAVSHGTIGQVSVWDLHSGTRLLTIEAGAFIRGMRFTRRGDRLIGCGQDFRAHVWDTTTGDETLTLIGHQGDCVEAFLSPDSNIAATTGWDNTVRLWDMRTGAQIATPLLNATAVGFGDALVTSLGSLATLWRFEDSPEFQRILPQTPLRNRATIALDGAGDRIIAADETGVRLFDASTGEELARIIDAPAVFARIVEDGRAALVAIDSGVWRVPLEVHRGVQIVPGEPQRLLARTGIRGCDFDPSHRRLVLVLADEIEIYEWPSRQLLHHLPGFEGLDRFASLDPTGQWLFTGNWRGENARVWNVNTGETVHQFNAPNVTGAFNPAGGELITSTGVTFDTLSVGDWKLKSKRTRNHTGELAGHIAYSADGALLALTNSRVEVHLLDPKTGRILARLFSPEPAAMSGIALSADGSTLAATTTLGEIHVWDLARIRAELAAMGLDWD